ncbi:nose resistant to fluoxetine protein 6-like [Oratosquilla oratoria]|uniref:nose resistant to fluoxetine protein 6-like n=1 Tax=Oratosquilla oratoria TaxID=337810 RepID=UPI003F76FACA
MIGPGLSPPHCSPRRLSTRVWGWGLLVLVVVCSHPVRSSSSTSADNWSSGFKNVTVEDDDGGGGELDRQFQYVVSSALEHVGSPVFWRWLQPASTSSSSSSRDPRKSGTSSSNLLHMYLPSLESNKTNPKCKEDLSRMMKALQSPKPWWSIKMVDAWGKVTDGIFGGPMYVLGSYPECLDVKSSDEGDDIILGKYCLVSYRVPRKSSSVGEDPTLKKMSSSVDQRGHTQELWSRTQRVPDISGSEVILPIPRNYGTCMPDRCTQGDLQVAVLDHLNSPGATVAVHCTTAKSELTFDASDIVVICLLSLLLFLLLAGAAVDLYIQHTKKTELAKGPLRFLLPFSLWTNWLKLFHISEDHRPGTITCLHGFRVLSMCWVVYGHQTLFSFWFSSNLIEESKKTSTLMYQIVANATISVDSFFFMSGLLVVYGVMRELDRTGRFNAAMYYVHRVIRLTPPIAITAAVLATLVRWIPRGPLAFGASAISDGCRKYWWKDVFYINNFMTVDENRQPAYCIGQCWYTSVDTQLYVVAPLLFLPLHFFPSQGRLLLYLATLASVLTPAILTVVNDYLPTKLLGSPMNKYSDYSLFVYNMTWCRAGPYLVGMWTGYFLFKISKRKFVMRPWQVVVGWTASTFVGAGVVFGMWSYNVLTNPMQFDVMTQFFYGGFHRTVWALALAWIIIACHTGYGGSVNSFLSYPGWQPLSRLTYSMFLTSLSIQTLMLYNTKKVLYFSTTNKILEMTGSLMVTAIASIGLTLSTESPVLGLEKLLLHRPGRGG